MCVNAEFASSHELCKTEDQPPAAYLVDDADDCCLLRRRRRRRRLIEEPLRRRTRRQYSHHPPVDMSGRPRTTSFAEGNKTSPNPPLGGIKVISTYLHVLVYTHTHICTFTLITLPCALKIIYFSILTHDDNTPSWQVDPHNLCLSFKRSS